MFRERAWYKELDPNPLKERLDWLAQHLDSYETLAPSQIPERFGNWVENLKQAFLNDGMKRWVSGEFQLERDKDPLPIYETLNLGWGAFTARVRRAEAKSHGTASKAETLHLVRWLLPDWSDEEIVSPIVRCIPDEAEDADFSIVCPTQIFDHRIVVLGQLPSPANHAVVFIRPEKPETHPLWWPQHDVRQPDPRAGRAAMVMGHCGNPELIAHQPPWNGYPVTYAVRAYAVRKPWSHGANPRPLSEAERLLEGCDVVDGPIVRTVVRVTGIDRVNLTAPGTSVSLSPYRQCTAPVTLRWDGLKKVEVEIRSPDLDYRLDEATIDGSSLTLTLPDCRGSGDNEVPLTHPGLYRIRLHSAGRPRRSFADSLHEIWLQIDGPSRSSSSPPPKSAPTPSMEGPRVSTCDAGIAYAEYENSAMTLANALKGSGDVSMARARVAQAALVSRQSLLRLRVEIHPRVDFGSHEAILAAVGQQPELNLLAGLVRDAVGERAGLVFTLAVLIGRAINQGSATSSNEAGGMCDELGVPREVLGACVTEKGWEPFRAWLSVNFSAIGL